MDLILGILVKNINSGAGKIMQGIEDMLYM